MDGGITWKKIEWKEKYNTSSNDDLNSILFIDDKKGFITGNDGFILLTDDGGNTWHENRLINNHYFYEITNNCNSQILIAGGGFDNNGILFQSTDLGKTFKKVIEHAEGRLRAIECISANKIFVIGKNWTVHISHNGGVTWKSKKINTDGAYRDNDLLNIHFFNDLKGIILCQYGIYCTTVDGGNSWQLQKMDTEYGLISIAVKGEESYIGGGGGFFVKMNNSGTKSIAKWTNEDGKTRLIFTQ